MKAVTDAAVVKANSVGPGGPIKKASYQKMMSAYSKWRAEVDAELGFFDEDESSHAAIYRLDAYIKKHSRRGRQ
jgi:hypothetical protein